MGSRCVKPSKRRYHLSGVKAVLELGIGTGTPCKHTVLLTMSAGNERLDPVRLQLTHEMITTLFQDPDVDVLDHVKKVWQIHTTSNANLDDLDVIVLPLTSMMM